MCLSLCLADAVFESVAQVLLSHSRGLRSRFKQVTMKADAEVRMYVRVYVCTYVMT